MFQFPVTSSTVPDDKRDDISSRFCYFHLERFFTLVYKLVAAHADCMPHLYYCDEAFH
jgi:hypothetical protein